MSKALWVVACEPERTPAGDLVLVAEPQSALELEREYRVRVSPHVLCLLAAQIMYAEALAGMARAGVQFVQEAPGPERVP